MIAMHYSRPLTRIKAQNYESKTAFIEKKLYLLQSYP